MSHAYLERQSAVVFPAYDDASYVPSMPHRPKRACDIWDNWLHLVHQLMLHVAVKLPNAIAIPANTNDTENVIIMIDFFAH